MKKTYVFDMLDNALGNYAEGKATSFEVCQVAYDVNKYLNEHTHPHDTFNCGKCDDKKLLEVTNLDGYINVRKCPFCIQPITNAPL